MAIIWDNYRIALEKRWGKLLIVHGKTTKEGRFKRDDRSEDRTNEIVEQVMHMMKWKADQQKKEYVGYEIPRVGKLVFIKAGSKFKVTNR